MRRRIVEPIWPHDRGPRGRAKARTTLNSQRPATSFAPQCSCLFLNLPPELRDEIYCFLLPSCTTLCFAAPMWVDHYAGRFFSVRCDMTQYSLKVLGLCQQIRAEANAVLYGTNHFEFSMGRAGGPSPFNTIRSLPQSGISQLKSCTISVINPCIDKGHLDLLTGWMDEMCGLLVKGGNLQEVKIEIVLNNLFNVSSDLAGFNPILRPLERLNGLKSAVVKGLVDKAYGARLKTILEGDRSRKYKRKAGVDDEEEVVLRPRQKLRDE